MAKQPPSVSSTKLSASSKPVTVSLMCMHELPRQLKVHTDPYGSLTTPASSKARLPLGNSKLGHQYELCRTEKVICSLLKL